MGKFLLHIVSVVNSDAGYASFTFKALALSLITLMEIIITDVIADTSVGVSIGEQSVRNYILCKLGCYFIVTSIYEV